jgi:hypothetical protein
LLIVLLAAESNASSVSNEAQSAGPNKVFLPSIHYMPPGPNTPPLPSTSYYFFMRYYTPTKAQALGCELGRRDANLAGKQDSLVILAFGIPKYVSGKYGASGMMVGGFVDTEKIAEAVQHFGTGYWICTGNDYESHMRIGIGTNNYNNSSVYSDLSVTYGHGKAWADMVNRVAEYFLHTCPRGCDGQVDVVGANDIELAWSSALVAQNWVSGYASASRYPLYNFGAAEGCPNACGGGGYSWTREQVWRVTNAWPVYPLPEIYRVDGRNAEQWYQLSAYSAITHGYPYQFVGTMTTYGACQQVNDPLCPIIDNTPQQGWQQLYSRINGANPATWHPLPYSTDIRWSE